MEQYLTLTNLSSVIADALCILIFLIFAVVCSKKGFCKCIMPIVVVIFSFVAAIFGSKALEEPFANLLFPLVNDKLTQSLEEMVADMQGQNGILGIVLSRIDVSEGVAKLAEDVTKEFAHIALFIIILLLSIIIFSLIGKIAGKITELPIIRTFDGTLGFIYGLLQCFVLFFIAIKLCSALKIDFFTKYSEGTYILLWLNSL